MTHDHAHGTRTGRGRLAVAFGLTASVMVAEVVGAFLTGSLALLIDAAHMLTDAGGLLIALIAATLATRPPTAERTWGYRRAEVIGAAAQAAILLAVGVFVVIQAVQRMFQPAEVDGPLMVVFGAVGLLANVIAIGVLLGDRSANLNLRAAFLEVVNDALGSVAVIVAAVVIAFTGFAYADSIAAVLIGALIVPRAVLLLRETVHVLLESAPRGLDLDEVREHLLRVPHVQGVHDLHVTQIATGLPVLTAHIVVDDSCFFDGHAPHLLDQLQHVVAAHLPVQIEHSTFQLELEAHAAHEGHTHD